MSGPDYWGDNDKPKKADWKKHERDVANRTGDRRVRGSGNQPGKPMDVSGRRGRECKATLQRSMSVTIKWLANLAEQAVSMNVRPVLELRLELIEAPTPADWVLVPAQDIDDLLEAVAEPEPGPSWDRERETTPHASLGISVERLEGLVEQAEKGQSPTLEIRFTQLMGRPGVPADWVLMPAADYDLLEELACETR